jgi:DNA-directed RNA polymerase I, II, and III subunit RPABC2
MSYNFVEPKEQYSLNDALDAAEADDDDYSEIDIDEEPHDDDDDEDDELSNSDDEEEKEGIKELTNEKVLEAEEEEDSDSDENYLQKFDEELTNNYILDNHQEEIVQNYAEVLTLSKIVKDSEGNIIDQFHRTNPILTKYEKTKVLGQRTKQLNNGAKPLIKLNENIIDSYIIAEMELKEKVIPFIIRRPLANGASEYWTLQDLEIL